MTQFFTNEPERDLYTRFAKIIDDGTQFFDILVGYFRSSGFFRLYKSLENVQNIRILVGLNIDSRTQDLLKNFSHEIINEFDNSEVSYNIEDGAKKFISWLKSGKIQMRLYPDSKTRLHAKVYILRRNNGLNSVITGSSNFSEAGLIDNIEFNVELNDESDVKFALDKFNSLWSQSIDINNIYIDTAENHTWLRDDIMPYEIYLKTLYEFFYDEINSDKENLSLFNGRIPRDYIRLQYQIDAVIQAKKMLESYNGVFISDVVGLGKTYICAMLAKILPAGRKLIICPPVLIDYWRDVLADFEVAAKVESLGKLDNILSSKQDYDYIFIDEAHRFRNSYTEGFTKLHEICHNKKVILISATPINNYSSDIANQIYLFQPRHSSNIPGVRNLDLFFKRINDKLKNLDGNSPEYIKQNRANSEEIRDKILRHIMIRRTRSEIINYYKSDMLKQGLSFPEVKSPEKIIYSFDDRIDKFFNETMNIIKNFNYSRYKPLTYLINPGKFAGLLTSQHNMGGFMKCLLVKRLESSFHAFRMTLNRFIDSYKKFIDMLNNHHGVYISSNLDIYDLLDSGNTDELINQVENNNARYFNESEFNTNFIIDLIDDLKDLEKLRGWWDSVKTDPKLEKFCDDLIHNNILSASKKIIIFTESTETAKYLYDNLQKIYNSRVIYFSGDSSKSLKSKIESSFNPKNFDSLHPESDLYDVLITTDILSEGINLHQANIIINYDLPWNPTRIMQRVGRINRVGTSHSNIYVFNFFPTAQSDKHLSLKAKILNKLQMFNDTLGNDYKYLSEDENPSPKKLFDVLDELTSINGDNDSSEDGELKYLQAIRNIRDNDNILFSKLARLPAMAKTGKFSHEIISSSTLTFIRKGALKEFFITQGSQTRQISFTEAAKILECTPDESCAKIESDYFTQLELNNKAFDESLTHENITDLTRPFLTGNEKKFFNELKSIQYARILNDTQQNIISRIIRACEEGRLPPNLIKSALKFFAGTHNSSEKFAVIETLIPRSYLYTRKEAAIKHDGAKHVILSCYIRGTHS